jgi:hypothetical protein
MRRPLILLPLAALLLAAAPASRPAAAPPTALRIDGEGLTPITLSPANIAAKPHIELKVKEHSGETATYSGVPLRDLLAAAGAPLANDQLRGKALALYALAEGTDGYQVVIALPELAPGFTDVAILVADKRNGQPLAPTDGPFKLIVPQDKRQGRWVRLLAAIHLQRATPPAK